MIKALFTLLIFFLISSNSIHAVYNPLSVPNNKFGIHIIDENDIENASILVNSTGGDWGYVTIVIPDNDLNLVKWQNTLDKLNFYHLIPLIRLATHLDNGTWVKPVPEDAEKWANFLNSLFWPIQNRYLILFNEPNHNKEWSNRANPREYAEIVKIFSRKLKSLSPDYFILPAGLDASAPNGDYTISEPDFLIKLITADPDYFSYIDGWTSHSYPNPGFKGSPRDKGRGSIKTFEWEIAFLKSNSLRRDLSVFITETGWPHNEGEVYDNRFYDEFEITQLLKTAMAEVWDDNNIMAVTPFILNYKTYPFDNFSWQKPNSEGFYDYYYYYQKYPKVPGKPRLNEIEIKPLAIPEDNQQQSSVLKDKISRNFFSIKRFFRILFKLEDKL